MPEIGMIFENLVGLAGLALEMGFATLKVLLILVLITALIIPLFMGIRVHHRRQERARNPLGSMGGSVQNHEALNQGAPAIPAEKVVVPGGALRVPAPPRLLDDPETWILQQYPEKGWVIVKLLIIVGTVTAILATAIVGLLEAWGTLRPDPEEDHTLWDFNPHMSTYSDDSMPWTSSADIVESLDRDAR